MTTTDRKIRFFNETFNNRNNLDENLMRLYSVSYHCHERKLPSVSNQLPTNYPTAS
jgi:hypothetical protein